VAWLPDRKIVLHRDAALWREERLRRLGSTPRHQAFWGLLDQLAEAFWKASRNGVKLPLRSPADVVDACRRLGPRRLPMARYLGWTVGDALRRHGLRGDAALVGLLSMLIEDTVHSTVDRAPLLNAALGVTIRGAGLSRAQGGMRGFWERFVARYRALGGDLRVGWLVERIEAAGGRYALRGRRGPVTAAQVVSAVPVAATAELAPELVGRRLERFLRRDAGHLGGAIVVSLGVPEDEVAGQAFTHHQLLQSYRHPLGNGNNMFVSVSAPGDLASAPAGYRAVMLSTHCELSDWEGLDRAAHEERRRQAGERLLASARRVYSRLGDRALVYEVGTPRTYERYVHRPRGAVGGVRQSLANANQNAIPHDLGPPGFWLAGDTTWPGLGTVACVLGSRLVAEGVLRRARRDRVPHPSPTGLATAKEIG
jgi:phytoene dehydrogenase-like protein